MLTIKNQGQAVKRPNYWGIKHAIAWVCRHHPYRVIGDPCMGRGLVGKHAYLSGRRFVGTELNPKRLAVLVDFIKKQEAKK